MTTLTAVACCARCTKPIVGEHFSVGRFFYGSCCIEQVKEQNPTSKVEVKK